MDFSRTLAVLGGSCLDPERLQVAARQARLVIAVDAGYRHCESVGFLPQILAGDFDSVALENIPSTVHQVPLFDQEHTDTTKLMAWCHDQGCERIHLICSEGGLPDHQLQTYFSACASKLDVWFIFDRGMGRIICPLPHLTTIKTEPKSRVSLLPLTRCESVTLTGTAWPLENDQLEPCGKTSISNQALANEVQCSLESGNALLFWETNDIIWE